MKSTGIRRKVDDLGRIVIPAGVRKTLGIREGDAMDVSVDGDKVILAKPQDRCVFCGTDEDLQEFRSKAMCRACVASVGVLDERLRLSRQVQEREQPKDTGLPEWDAPTPSRPAATEEPESSPNGRDAPAPEAADPADDRSDTPRGQPAPDAPSSTTAW